MKSHNKIKRIKTKMVYPKHNKQQLERNNMKIKILKYTIKKVQ